MRTTRSSAPVCFRPCGAAGTGQHRGPGSDVDRLVVERHDAVAAQHVVDLVLVLLVVADAGAGLAARASGRRSASRRLVEEGVADGLTAAVVGAGLGLLDVGVVLDDDSRPSPWPAAPPDGRTANTSAPPTRTPLTKTNRIMGVKYGVLLRQSQRDRGAICPTCRPPAAETSSKPPAPPPSAPPCFRPTRSRSRAPGGATPSSAPAIAAAACGAAISCKRYPDLLEFVGLCDINPKRALVASDLHRRPTARRSRTSTR